MTNTQLTWPAHTPSQLPWHAHWPEVPVWCAVSSALPSLTRLAYYISAPWWVVAVLKQQPTGSAVLPDRPLETELQSALYSAGCEFYPNTDPTKWSQQFFFLLPPNLISQNVSKPSADDDDDLWRFRKHEEHLDCFWIPRRYHRTYGTELQITCRLRWSLVRTTWRPHCLLIRPYVRPRSTPFAASDSAKNIVGRFRVQPRGPAGDSCGVSAQCRPWPGFRVRRPVHCGNRTLWNHCLLMWAGHLYILSGGPVHMLTFAVSLIP